MPLGQCQQGLDERRVLAAQFRGGLGQVGARERFVVQIVERRPRPARAPGSTSAIRRCPRPRRTRITFSAGPASRHSRGTRTPWQWTSPVWLAVRPTSLGGAGISTPGKSVGSASRICWPSSSTAPVTMVLAWSAPVTQGEKPSSRKCVPLVAGRQHRFGQVAAAGREVRDADGRKCLARRQAVPAVAA